MEADVVYENKFEVDEYVPPDPDATCIDSVFTLLDFILQATIWIVSVIFILTKEGWIDTFAPN